MMRSLILGLPLLLFLGCSHRQNFIGAQNTKLDLATLPHGVVIEKNLRDFLGKGKIPHRVLLEESYDTWHRVARGVAFDRVLDLQGVQEEHARTFYKKLPMASFPKGVYVFTEADGGKIFPQNWWKKLGDYDISLGFTDLYLNQKGDAAIFGLSMYFSPLDGSWGGGVTALILLKKVDDHWQQVDRINVAIS